MRSDCADMMALRFVVTVLCLFRVCAWDVIRDAAGARIVIDVANLESDVAAFRRDLNRQEKVDIPPPFVAAEHDSSSLVGRRLSSGFTTAEKKILLDLHNTYRANVAAVLVGDEPSATNMNEMFWDPALAQVAQDYADKCNYGHNSDRVDEFVALEDNATFEVTASRWTLGENIMASPDTSTSLISAALFGMGLFFVEHEDYTFSSNDCTDTCGHYTQIVQAQTRYVGCGATMCDSLTGADSGGSDYYETNGGFYLVCDYSVSQSSSQPYEDGTACSNCDDDRLICTNSSLCGGCMRYNYDACTDYYTSGCLADDCGNNCDAFGCQYNETHPCPFWCYYCYDTCGVSGCDSAPADCCDNGWFLLMYAMQQSTPIQLAHMCSAPFCRVLLVGVGDDVGSNCVRIS